MDWGAHVRTIFLPDVAPDIDENGTGFYGRRSRLELDSPKLQITENKALVPLYTRKLLLTLLF